MAKLARESKLREKRAEKQARKAARKLEAENPSPEPDGAFDDELAEPLPLGVEPPSADSPLAAVADAPSDA